MSEAMEKEIVRAARVWWKRTNPPIVGAGPQHIETLWAAVGKLVEREARLERKASQNEHG